MKLVYSIGLSVFIGFWCYGCLSFENELRSSSSFLLAWNSKTMICFHKSFPEPSTLCIENHIYKWKSQIFFWFPEFLWRPKVRENVLQILTCYANVNYYFSKSKGWISLHTYSCYCLQIYFHHPFSFMYLAGFVLLTWKFSTFKNSFQYLALPCANFVNFLLTTEYLMSQFLYLWNGDSRIYLLRLLRMWRHFDHSSQYTCNKHSLVPGTKEAWNKMLVIIITVNNITLGDWLWILQESWDGYIR